MKSLNLFVAILLFFGSSAEAIPSYLGKADNQSVIVSVRTDKVAYAVGDTAVFTGTIKVSGKKSFMEELLDWLFGNKDKGLYEDFKKNGLDLVGSFPSSAVDVSSKITFQSVGRDELKFRYESEAIRSADLNQFSLKVFNNHSDKTKLKHLGYIQGKLEKRLAALKDLLEGFKKKKALSAAIAVIEKEMALLRAVRVRIEERINSDDNLIALNTSPIQVGNGETGLAIVGTSINGFRFSVVATPGVQFEKSPVDIVSAISRVDRDLNDDYFKHKDKYEYVAELYRDGHLIVSGVMDKTGEEVSLSTSTSDLLWSGGAQYELVLNRTDKGKKKTKIGSLTYQPVILRDQVPPMWNLSGQPSGEVYSKQMPAISLSVEDTFGRLDRGTLDIKLVGLDGSQVIYDLLPNLTVVQAGTEIVISSPGANLNEGSYQFLASISDLGGNLATYSAKVVIDRTMPAILFGHVDGFESPTMDFTLNSTINDLSAVYSKVYFNGSQVSFSNEKIFSVPVKLRPGNNKFVVESKDAAGNESTSETQVVFDITPPVLSFISPGSTEKVYTNKLPILLPVNVTADEFLSSAEINGKSISLSQGATSVEGVVSISSVGKSILTVKAIDLAGNAAVINQTIETVFDDSPAQVWLGYSGPQYSNQYTQEVKVKITDAAPVLSKVYVNEELYFETGSKDFEVPFSLSKEGANTFKVVSKDLAGNESNSGTLIVLRDTLTPVITNLRPTAGSSIDRIAFIVSGSSNERLKNIDVNGLKLNFNSNKNTFEGTYIGVQGSQKLKWTGSDLAGNSFAFESEIEVIQQLLIPELVSVISDNDNTHMWVIGAASSTRPRSEVRVSSSLFNGSTVVSRDDGSFQVRLSNFSTATVKVTDLQSQQSDQMTVAFSNATSLAGVVRDHEDAPIINALVRIEGGAQTVYTDSSGKFLFINPPTGDRKLIVNGTTAALPTGGANRQFTTTFIALNIGLGQVNVIEEPIYLTPLFLDGTETPINAVSSATVTSTHAPGVALSIPAGATVFPGGSGVGKINMMTVPASRATTPVPASFIPTNVVALEPSGTTFTKKVAVSLPNENELPPGTPMVFISMNSSKGTWEIDGTGKVSENGLSVVSDPNSGITHFSSIYAVPLAPIIAGIQNPNILGIDASEGSLRNSIEAPSFKVFGASITPSLTYKSSWANPTVVVSNIFAVPEPMPPASGSGSGTENIAAGWQKSVNCWEVMWGWQECRSAWFHYLLENSYDLNWQATNLWVPDTVKSQFFVSRLASDIVTISNTEVDEEIGHIEEKQLDGTVVSNAEATKIIEQTGLPKAGIISFGMVLKDTKTNEYLQSGIYPALSRFQIKLKHLTITTVNANVTTRTYIDGDFYKKDSTTKVRTSIDFALASMQPQDLQSDILLQNKVHSSAGRGWHVNGSSRIYNPENSRVMIEEGNGDVSTYALNNLITTVFDGTSSDVDLAGGVDISVWPYAVAARHLSATKESQIAEIDLSSSSPTPKMVSPLKQLEGKLASQGWYKCNKTTNCNLNGCSDTYSGNFNSVRYAYKSKYILGGVLRSSTGEVFTTNISEHLLHRDFGNIKLSGEVAAPYYSTSESVVYGGMEQFGYFNRLPEKVNEYCSKRFGYSCGVAEPQNNQFACNFYAAPFILADSGVGELGAPTGWGTSGLNSPTGLIAAPDGKLIIADTGNNRVMAYNLQNSTVAIFAGNQRNEDKGDGGRAINASLFHPKGLVYDDLGNLYISTENGFIRKVDSKGIITTFAGGTTVADQAAASEIMLSDPQGMVFDSVNRYLYVADTGNHRVLQIDMNTGLANKVAGNNQCSPVVGDEGSALLATICRPTHLGLDDNNNLIVVDSGHKRIRRITFSRPTSGAIAFSSSNGDNSKLVKNSDGSWLRTMRDGTKIMYDANGIQKNETDRSGMLISYDHDIDGNLLAITYPNGKSLRYNYGGGKVRSIVDPAGRLTLLSYDGDFLSRVDFPDGTSRGFEYDESGQMLSETSQNGALTGYQYNAWNRLHKVTKADGSTQTVNDIASQTIANSYSGGVVGEMKGIGYGDGQASTKVVDELSNVVEVTTDHLGFVSSVKDPKGKITKIRRDFAGRPVEIIKPEGSIVSYEYDKITGDLLVVNDTGTGEKIVREYDSWGNVTKVTDSAGRSTIRKFDPNTGFLLESAVVGGAIQRYKYNSIGQLVEKSLVGSAGSLLTSIEYDAAGYVNKETLPDGSFLQFSYDLSGNQISAIQTSGVGAPKTYTRSFDAFNRLSTVRDPSGGITSYSYNALGKLTTIKFPSEKSSHFEYDILGRVVSKRNPLGIVNSYEYDQRGQVVQEVDGNGNIRRYMYDETGRIKRVQSNDDAISYSYGEDNRLSSLSSNSSKINLSYDSRGRVFRESISGQGQVVQYPASNQEFQYDASGNLKGIKTGYGDLAYGYDEAGRLVQVSSPWGGVFSISYDSLSRRSRVGRVGGYVDYGYGTSGNLQSVSNYVNGSLIDFTQISLNNSLVASKRSPAGESIYQYDSSGQLSSASLTGETYQYDLLGNRLSDALGREYTYDASGYRLNSDGVYDYLYDANGNQISKISKSGSQHSFKYTYNSANQMVAVKEYVNFSDVVARVEVNYVYDVVGRRIKKTVINRQYPVDSKKNYTRYYHYSGQNLLAEFDGNGVMLARYTSDPLKMDEIYSISITSGGVAAGLSSQTGQHYLQKDHLGSTTAVVGENGALLQRYKYDSFGKILKIESASGTDVTLNPPVRTSIAFTGREYEDETGLYYYRARFYDPHVGRFIQEDPDPGVLLNPASLNSKYVYVQNNPLIFKDPTGEVMGWDDFLFIVGIALIGTAVENHFEGGNFLEQFGRNFLNAAIVYAIGVGIGGAPIADMSAWKGFGSGLVAGLKQAAIQGFGRVLAHNKWMDPKTYQIATAVTGVGISIGRASESDLSWNQELGNLLTGGDAADVGRDPFRDFNAQIYKFLDKILPKHKSQAH
ncbi:RHS repeat-associated core domain-containing protein [Bdellovibrio bacteriovorus]|uniref:RHS repeat-associated core domain-containing protein n=1 Tax=Bdellovibrio bacteriovorus TaxID=959 RepID=UPI003AA8BDF4